MSEKPFTIALPTKNGGQLLEQCVKSILNQSYHGFELVILDNASTDGSGEWLANIKDPRVRIWRSAVPLSIEENWGRILQVPQKNQFLTTIGHDDLLDEDFFAVILDLIHRHPEAGLYTTHFRFIDAEGRISRSCRPIPEQETGPEFVAARLAFIRDSFGTGHVLRSETYEKWGGIPNFPKLLYADDALMLAAMGSSYRATDKRECFSYRFDASSMSGGATPLESIAAFERYAQVLRQLAENDQQLASILNRYAPGHLMRLARGGFRQLWSYPKGDRRRLHDDLENRIHSILVRITNNASAQLPYDRRLAFAKRASRSSLASLFHFTWSFIRGGRRRAGDFHARADAK